jgi:hypothetical protein
MVNRLRFQAGYLETLRAFSFDEVKMILGKMV